MSFEPQGWGGVSGAAPGLWQSQRETAPLMVHVERRPGIRLRFDEERFLCPRVEENDFCEGEKI